MKRRRSPTAYTSKPRTFLRLLALTVILSFSPSVAETDDPRRDDRSSVEEIYPSIVDEEWRGVVFTPVKANRGFSFHKQTFVLPLTWSNEYNGEETEVVFQLSFKVRILQSRFYAAFSTVSFWQAYDTDNSSPFRETNYNPEVFYRVTPSNSKLEDWGFDAGFEHESNGQTIELSRSWNRLYFAPHYRFKKSFLRAKVWYRIPEEDCTIADEIDCDNNPDITDYYGHFEVTYDMQIGDKQEPPLLHVMAGGSITNGKGRVSFTFSYPARSKDIYWHLWAFYGYGESMIDYDQLRSRIGVGFLFIR